MVKDVVLPVDLPAGWTAEESSFGILIEGRGEDGRGIGGVTINETVRGYALGISPVRRLFTDDPSPYQGRGWREKLYRDAIDALRNGACG